LFSIVARYMFTAFKLNWHNLNKQNRFTPLVKSNSIKVRKLRLKALEWNLRQLIFTWSFADYKKLKIFFRGFVKALHIHPSIIPYKVHNRRNWGLLLNDNRILFYGKCSYRCIDDVKKGYYCSIILCRYSRHSTLAILRGNPHWTYKRCLWNHFRILTH